MLLSAEAWAESKNAASRVLRALNCRAALGSGTGQGGRYRPASLRRRHFGMGLANGGLGPFPRILDEIHAEHEEEIDIAADAFNGNLPVLNPQMPRHPVWDALLHPLNQNNQFQLDDNAHGAMEVVEEEEAEEMRVF